MSILRLWPVAALGAAGQLGMDCQRGVHAAQRASLVALLLLQRGQTSRLPQASATQLCSAAGTVWITLDHDLRDIVLEPGQCFATPGDRGVTISALSGPAVLDLRPSRRSA